MHFARPPLARSHPVRFIDSMTHDRSIADDTLPHRRAPVRRSAIPIAALGLLLFATTASGKGRQPFKPRGHQHSRGVAAVTMSSKGDVILSAGVKSGKLKWSLGPDVWVRNPSPAYAAGRVGEAELEGIVGGAVFLPERLEVAVLDMAGVVHLLHLGSGKTAPLEVLSLAESAKAVFPTLAVASAGGPTIAVGTGTPRASGKGSPGQPTPQSVVVHAFKDGAWGHEVLPAHKGCVTTLAFSEFGHVLFGGGAEPGIRVWHVEEGSLLKTIGRSDTDVVRALACTPDFQRVAANGTDGRLIVWNVNTDMIVWARTMPKSTTISHLLFSPDATHLYVAGTGLYHVWILDASSGKELARLGRIGRSCAGLSQQADGKQLAVASGNKVTVWNVPKALRDARK
jgi:WD40 repeat protein